MTPQDLKQIGSLFDKKFNKIDERFDGIDKNFVEIKADIAVLKYKAEENKKAITEINDNLLQWKSEMFDSAEKFMRETDDQREFRTVGGYQLAQSVNRINDLEKKVFGTIVGA